MGYGPIGSNKLGDTQLFVARLNANQERPLVAADFALSAGFGTTASVTVVAGSTAQRWRISITSAGTGQGANPTCTLTFPGGPWPNGTRAAIFRNGGTGSTLVASWSGQPTTTGLVLTCAGTPQDGLTYAYDCIMMG